jgi:outer membrane lipoprotein-sorting protein
MTSMRLITAAILLTLDAAQATAQTADEIIEKHLAAMGGREALATIRTRVSTGSITLTTAGGPVSGTVESFAKAPNKSRTLISLDLTALGAGKIVNDQRFDGTTGFIIDTFNGNRDITGSQLEALRNSAFPTAWLDYRARGLTITLSGQESLGDRATFVLETTPKAGPRVRSWVDAETFLLLKTSVTISSPGVGEIEQINEFSDFRTVDGVKVPFLVKSLNAVQAATATLTSVRHNVEIDDASFVKP